MRAPSQAASSRVVISVPRSSSATTNSSLRTAASSRLPSISMARCGSQPVRWPGLDLDEGGLAASGPSRVRYSSTASRTQRGMRVPTAMRRTRKRVRKYVLAPALAVPLLAERPAGAPVPPVSGFPHALETVELAHARQHHVQHDVVQVHQHPLAFALAFDAERTVAGLLRLLDDAIGDGAHVAVRIARGDDHDIRNVCDPSHVHHLHVDGLHVFQCGRDDVFLTVSRAGTRGLPRVGARRERVRVVMWRGLSPRA